MIVISIKNLPNSIIMTSIVPPNICHASWRKVNAMVKKRQPTNPHAPSKIPIARNDELQVLMSNDQNIKINPCNDRRKKNMNTTNWQLSYKCMYFVYLCLLDQSQLNTTEKQCVGMRVVILNGLHIKHSQLIADSTHCIRQSHLVSLSFMREYFFDTFDAGSIFIGFI